jgi:hypothetical protein
VKPEMILFFVKSLYKSIIRPAVEKMVADSESSLDDFALRFLDYLLMPNGPLDPPA